MDTTLELVLDEQTTSNPGELLHLLCEPCLLAGRSTIAFCGYDLAHDVIGSADDFPVCAVCDDIYQRIRGPRGSGCPTCHHLLH